MKIQKAIMSVDDNPLYSDFWPLVSRVWKQRLGIEPVLIYFGDKKLDEKYGQVINVKPVKDIPTHLQAQWARFWYTSQEPDTTFIISDIDMFPISRRFFIDNVANIDENKYAHLDAATMPLCVCYHVAKGRKFKEVLGLADTFEESMHDMCNMKRNDIKDVHMGLARWGLDEAYTTKKIYEYHKKNEIILKPRDHRGLRIDRSSWRYDVKLLIQRDHYIDSHSLRPYRGLFKDEIDKLVQILAGRSK